MKVPADGGEEEPRNINLHGAVLHVIGDLIQSLGVAVAGAIIWIKQVSTSSALPLQKTTIKLESASALSVFSELKLPDPFQH